MADNPQQPTPRILRVGGTLPDPPFDPEPERERIRGRLAWALVALLGGTIFLAFVLVGLERVSAADMRSLLQPIIPAEVALAGSATGFYFGGQARGRNMRG